MADLKISLQSDNVSQAPTSRRTSFSSIDSDEKLPPSYNEVAGSDSAPTYDNSGEAIRFPSCFNLYHKSVNWRSTTWTLGEHASQPLFSIVLNSGWKGTTFVLHRGPDGKAPILAEMGSKRYMSIHNTISLPSHNIFEELHTKLSFKTAMYFFTAPVLLGEKTVAELFQWRQSHGREITQLSTNKYAWGWKLIRLGPEESASPYAVASSSKVERDVREVGESSDGLEVVAVWADNMRWSKNKLVRFEFMGSGSTGELGEVFEIMAVATGMRIWQILRTGTSGGGISSAIDVGAGAAVAN